MNKILNKSEKGISLPITLFVLVGLMLSAMILMKTGDVSVSVSGSLGTKVQLAGSNDETLNYAFKWIQDNKNALNDDDYGNGYFSSSSSSYVDYNNNSNWLNAKTLPKDDMGNVSSFKIMRLCAIPNAAQNEIVGGINNYCYTESDGGVTASNSSSGYAAYTYTQASGGTSILYKILIKTVGPRGGTLITESVVSI